MSGARRVRIRYELTAADAVPDAPGTGTDAPAAWWEESTRELRDGLAALGAGARAGARAGADRLHTDDLSARFVAEVAGGVVSEAVRLTMSWIGRSPHREARLTGPLGNVLMLTCEPGDDESDLIAGWLAAATGPASGSSPGSSSTPRAVAPPPASTPPACPPPPRASAPPAVPPPVPPSGPGSVG